MNLTESCIEADRITLEKLAVYRQQLIDLPAIAHAASIESFMDFEFNALVVRLKSYVLAEEVDCRSKIVEISSTFPVYQSWWQHFRGEVFPEWLKRKFPPKFNYVVKTGKKKVTFRKLATYPRANLIIPDNVGNTIIYRNQFREEGLGIQELAVLEPIKKTADNQSDCPHR